LRLVGLSETARKALNNLYEYLDTQPEIQGTRLAHRNWYGGKHLQMAHPAAIQGGWDAMD
jgi:hypothetical protein